MNNETKRHDTKRILIIGKKRTRLLYMFIILLTIIVLAIVYFLLPNILGKKQISSPQIRQMSNLTSKIGKLETEVQEKREEIFNLIQKYSQKTGELLPALTALGLSDIEREILEKKIINSKDVTFKSLLRDILDKDNEISGIKRAIDRYEALLPRPYIVKERENHYQIAMDFLINEKGVEKRKAIWLVERTALFYTLIPGFKVWNFYSGDEYGTFVTQGDALISPNELRRQVKRKLIDAKDSAISEKESLAAEIKILEKTRDNIISEVENLRNEKEDLVGQLKDLSTKNEEMKKDIQSLINSLSFMVELERNLKKDGILKRVFLGSPKLKGISSEYFNQIIDLREKNTIEIYAKQFNLTKIKEITLYPRFYKRGIDYEVKLDENKQKAVLTLLTVEKFKSERVVISIK